MYSALSNDRHECGPCSLCNRTSTRYFHADSCDSDKYTHFTNNVLPPALTAKKHLYYAVHATTISIATSAMRSTYPDGKNLKVASQQNSLHAPYKAVRAMQMLAQ